MLLKETKTLQTKKLKLNKRTAKNRTILIFALIGNTAQTNNFLIFNVSRLALALFLDWH